MKTSISYILFDIGRVLLDFDHAKSADQLARITGLTPAFIWETVYASGVELKYERGDLSTDDLYLLLRSHAKRQNFTVGDLIEAFGDMFTPKTEVFTVIEALKQQGFPLGLLSNTCEAHFLFFSKKFPIFQLFNNRTLSYEVRAMKPEPLMYHDALSKAQTKPHYCFYTDDIPDYVAAASNLGINAFTFKDVNKLINDLASVGIRV